MALIDPERVSQRLGDLCHALGLVALDVWVDARLAATHARVHRDHRR